MEFVRQQLKSMINFPAAPIISSLSSHHGDRRRILHITFRNVTFFTVFLAFVTVFLAYIKILPAAAQVIGSNVTDFHHRTTSSIDSLSVITVTSEYKHPVVSATIRGYRNKSRCSHQDGDNIEYNENANDDDAVAKLTFLSETLINNSALTTVTDDYDGPIMIQLGEPEAVMTTNFSTYNLVGEDGEELPFVLWKTQHFIQKLKPPPSYYLSSKEARTTNSTEEELCYIISWRVEYQDWNSSVKDYPSESLSFRNSQTFHRVWDASEFRVQQENGNNSSHGAFKSGEGGGEWLLRRNPNSDWGWFRTMSLFNNQNTTISTKDDAVIPSVTCSSWKKERPYSLVIVGDSQPSYMCRHLVDVLSHSSGEKSQVKVRCEMIQQTLQNQTSFLNYAHSLQNSTEDVVIFNPSGLWEAAYGIIDDFRTNFQKLLKYIPYVTKDLNTTGGETDSRGKRRKKYFFFAPTTAVHPINYPGLPNDPKKWCMTQTRVYEINKIARDLVLKESQSRLLWSNSKDDLNSILSVLPAPLDALSLSRDDDPMTPGDMRHFSNSTNEMLLTAMLCKIDEVWNQVRRP